MEPNQELLDWVTGLRRWFHQHPEPGFKETETQKKVIETLTELGIQHRTIAGTGVVADVQGRKDEARIALRADMDALRIAETEIGRHKGAGSAGYETQLFTGRKRFVSQNFMTDSQSDHHK